MVSKNVLSRPFPLPTKVIFVGNGFVDVFGGKSCDGAFSACSGFAKFDAKFDLSKFGGEFGVKIGFKIGVGFFGCRITSWVGGKVTVSGWLITTICLGCSGAFCRSINGFGGRAGGSGVGTFAPGCSGPTVRVLRTFGVSPGLDRAAGDGYS
jgi:hypothetical protein